MKRYDVAVVGLGIVGASAVYAAARAGARVLALDAGAPGDGTSGSSFAWLNANRKEPEAYHRLNAEGVAAHRELARELGGDAGYHEGGSLEWAEGGEPERELRERVARLAGRGYPASFLTREHALELESGLAIPDHVREVAFYAAEAWLDAPRSIRRLLAAVSEGGAEIRDRTPVRSLRVRGDRIEALVLDVGETTAGSVLVCVGPVTQAFLAPLGVTLPVGRVPGLLAVTSPVAAPLGRVVHAPGVHLRPGPGGGLVLGAEDVDEPAAQGDSAKVAELTALLRERAVRVFPPARDATIVDRRIGVRPMPADRHTIAGRIPGLTNGWVIATHSGVTLGPLLGRLIADEIVRGTVQPTLTPFRPERFAPAGAEAR
jgi:glycine/D-amino acid oxidase-like deaminating enzyme